MQHFYNYFLQNAYIDCKNASYPSAELAVALQNTANIVEIRVEDSNNLSDMSISLQGNYLPKLKELHIVRSKINTAAIAAIIQAAPNLEHLEIVECKKLNAMQIDLMDGGLSRLKNLKINYSDISAQSLSALIQSAPNLEILELENCNALNRMELELKRGGLSKCKYINIHSSNISAQSLVALLEAAPNLEVLELEYCNALNHMELELKHGGLSNCKNINIHSSDISAQSLAAIIQAAPNLGSINLRSLSELDGMKLDLGNDGLSKCKNIYLEKCNMPAHVLAAMIESAPNIESLNLGSLSKLDGMKLDLRNNGLSKCQHVHLKKCNMPANALAAMIESAPNLEDLDIELCYDLYSMHLTLNNGALLKLKRIRNKKCDISSETVAAIIQAAHNLESIELCEFSNLNPMHLELVPGSLSKVQTISLHDCNLPGPAVESLMKAATNHTHSVIVRCNKLTDIEKLKIVLYYAEKPNIQCIFSFDRANYTHALVTHATITQHLQERTNQTVDAIKDSEFPKIVEGLLASGIPVAVITHIFSFLRPDIFKAINPLVHEIKSLQECIPPKKDMLYSYMSEGVFGRLIEEYNQKEQNALDVLDLADARPNKAATNRT